MTTLNNLNSRTTASGKRAFDIIVWGGTGVVGRLVAEHLARDYQGTGVKWAIAGRNKEKLERVRDNLSSIEPSVKDIPIVTADITDQSSMENLAKQAKVVLATAGPFAKLGTPLVKACVDCKTDYCDITGETTWVRKIIREYDAKAKENGVRIINCSGFDSVPSDLGTFLVVDYIKKNYNRDTRQVEALWSNLAAPLSGGTVESLFGALLDDHGEDSVVTTDAYGLDPPDSIRGSDKTESILPGHSKLHNKPYVPFVMAPINTRIVRRSNALLGHKYGKNFSYLEAQEAPNRFAAYLTSFIFGIVGVLISRPFLRSFWLKILPKPGDMPPEDKMKKGHWTNTIVGVPEGQDSKKVKAEIKSIAGDPGYWSTARMLLEAGLTIALQEEELKVSDNIPSGVLTPASALGHVFLKRLNAQTQMLSFKIVES